MKKRGATISGQGSSEGEEPAMRPTDSCVRALRAEDHDSTGTLVRQLRASFQEQWADRVNPRWIADQATQWLAETRQRLLGQKSERSELGAFQSGPLSMKMWGSTTVAGTARTAPPRHRRTDFDA
jgi:hypothetical protein